MELACRRLDLDLELEWRSIIQFIWLKQFLLKNVSKYYSFYIAHYHWCSGCYWRFERGYRSVFVGNEVQDEEAGLDDVKISSGGIWLILDWANTFPNSPTDIFPDGFYCSSLDGQSGKRLVYEGVDSRFQDIVALFYDWEFVDGWSFSLLVKALSGCQSCVSVV